MGEARDIVMCIDAGYLEALTVALASLAAAHRSSALRIHVINEDLPPSSRRLVDDVAAHHSVHWVAPDLQRFSGTHLPPHLPRAALFRLAAPELIDLDGPTYLYLDADIVVRRDLAPLLSIELGEAVIAAVQDGWIEVAGAPNGPPFGPLGLRPTSPYFNSGVMLTSADRWLSSAVADEALHLLRAIHLPYADQDALNGVLEGRWLPLHPRWNLQTAHRYMACHSGDLAPHLAIAEARVDPSIVHFTGVKPWNDAGALGSELWKEVSAGVPEVVSPPASRPAPRGSSVARGATAVRHGLGARRKVLRRGVLALRDRAGKVGPKRSAGAGRESEYLDRAGGKVQQGAFVGTRLAGDAARRVLGNKLLPVIQGTYRQELEGELSQLILEDTSTAVVLGEPDPAIVAGLAARLPGLRVFLPGRSAVPAAVRACCADGGVAADRLSLAWPAEEDLHDGRVVCLLRGSVLPVELSVLARAKWLNRATTILECSGEQQPAELSRVILRLADECSGIAINQQGRNPSELPHLWDLREERRWQAIDEATPRSLYWLVFRPK